MGAMASQITSLTIVYSTVYSGTECQFPFDHVIMRIRPYYLYYSDAVISEWHPATHVRLLCDNIEYNGPNNYFVYMKMGGYLGTLGHAVTCWSTN